MAKKETASSPKATQVTHPTTESTTISKALTVANLEQLKEDTLKLLSYLEDFTDSDLSTIERMRKRGSGIRRYGFIDKVSDVASDNMDLAPRVFSDEDLKDLLRKIEELRNIVLAANQFARSLNDLLLIVGDEAYQLALMYYNSVRELARRRVPGAEAVFRLLRPFFRQTSRPKDEPTEHEVERDLKALLHGKKDGEIIIRNERPHMVGGKHEVIDEVHSGRAAVKEVIQAAEKE